MKILHLGKFYPPSMGGMEAILQNLAEGCAARGHEVRCIVHGGDGVGSVDQPVPGVTVMRLPWRFNIGSMPLTPAYLREFIRWRNWADIHHVHEPFPPASLSHLLFGGGRPTVVSWHAQITRQKLLKHLVEPLQWVLCRRASAIVVTGQRILDNTPRLQPWKAKGRLCPPGVNPAPLLAVAENAAEIDQTRARMGGRFMLACGRLVYYKGYDVLLRALPQCPDVRVVIVGDGPERAALDALAAERGVTDRVIFAGGAPDEELRRLYAACDAFLLPSTSPAETFGVVQVEAMLCAKPVLNTSLDTSVPEVSLHEVTGLTVTPGDVAELAAAINRLWSDDALRARFGAAGRARALAELSLDVAIDKIEAIYREAAATFRS